MKRSGPVKQAGFVCILFLIEDTKPKINQPGNPGQPASYNQTLKLWLELVPVGKLRDSKAQFCCTTGIAWCYS